MPKRNPRPDSFVSINPLGSDDVVSVNVYLTDMSDFGQMNEIYATRFSSPFPARTTIGCASLPLGARIEIGLTAKRQS
nr:RidA family protein [Neorhizobium galegae]